MGYRPRADYLRESLETRNKLWLELEKERIQWLKDWRTRKLQLGKAIEWYFNFVEEKKEGYVGSKIRVRNFISVLDEFNLTEYPFHALVTPLGKTRNIGAGPGKQYKKLFISQRKDDTDTVKQHKKDFSFRKHEPEE